MKKSVKNGASTIADKIKTESQALDLAKRKLENPVAQPAIKPPTETAIENALRTLAASEITRNDLFTINVALELPMAFWVLVAQAAAQKKMSIEDMLGDVIDASVAIVEWSNGDNLDQRAW